MTSIPQVINNATDKPLLEVPASRSSVTYEPLAYLDAYDAVLSCDYAFLAYKEVSTSRGAWKVRIRSSKTSGVVFEPDKMHDKAQRAAAQGEPWFAWGSGIEPSEGDPRQIAYRVHHQDGEPSAIEVSVVMRRADGTAGEPQSVTFAWPAG